MRESWRKDSFENLIRDGILEIGDGYRAKLDELGGTGPVFLRAALLDMSPERLRTAERFHDHLASRVSMKLSQAGDTIVTTKGNSVGRTGYVPDGLPPFVYSPHLSYWRSKDPGKLSSGYIRYWAKGLEFASQLSALAHGTDMAPYLSLADQRRLRITLPTISEQQAIANVLGALDDKIAVNERIVGGVHELGAAVFRAIFDDALRFLAENGSLGVEWRIRSLGEAIAVLETGTRPRGGVGAYTAGVPSIGAESIVQLAKFDYAKVKFVPDEFFASMRRGVLESHDILLYKDGGRPGKFEPHVSMFGNGFPFERACINEHVFRIRMSSPFTQAFGYYWLSSDPLMNEMRLRGTGVAVPGLNSTAVKELPLIQPPTHLLERFDRIALPNVNRALAAAAESQRLAVLREMLLPKLMSGEIRVRDAEREVEKAL